ncbi:VanZ family protein [Neobacillus sp. FSL H8-0543]|uniref:VanZ family protein n=1 Tax=Neobacillus sp. FSL H8-0543 TaxID=2954672 RepID=UPI0031594D6E
MKKSLFISMILSIIGFLLLSPVFSQLLSYLHPLVLLVVFLCIVFIIFFLVLLIRKQSLTLPYSLFLILFVLYTIFLLVLLFIRPNDQSYNSLNLVPFSTISLYLSGKVNGLVSFYNLAANIGLFIPFGIYLQESRYSNWNLIIIPIGGISFIEVLQFITHRGSLDIDDLVLNTLGVFLGYLLYPLFNRVITIKY